MSFVRVSNLPETSLRDFRAEKILGKGTYGQVIKFIHNMTNRPYAIKKMSMVRDDHKEILMIQKQIQILYRIKNKYIVELIDHFIDEEKKQIYLIMEYIEGKDLHKCVFSKKIQLDQSQIANIVYQIAIALAELHKFNIIHRDLKLQNVIYLPNKSIKLVDLGCSNYYGQNIQRITSIGTNFYFSPEILSADKQDDKLDIWCLSVMLYELLFLQSPFKGKDMFMKIRKLEYQIPQSHKNDYQLVDLFKRTFCYKNKRLSAKKFIQHPWIRKHLPKSQNQITIDKLLIDKQQLIHYKQFLLNEITKYQDKIDKLKRQNQLLENIKRKSEQFG